MVLGDILERVLYFILQQSFESQSFNQILFASLILLTIVKGDSLLW